MEMTTDKAISALIAADGTITETDALAAMAILRKQRAAAPDELLDTKAVCAALGISAPTVRKWAREGIIRRITVRGRRKAQGYSRNSVFDILKGRAA